MSEPVSDAAFELVGACVHSLRFNFGAPLDYPYAPAKLATENPPPALFRQVQAVAPPPRRAGQPWPAGMTLNGAPFDPDTWSGESLDRVEHDENAASLDEPDPATIVAEEWIRIPQFSQTMSFPGRDHGKYLPSIDYWNPAGPGEEVDKKVEYWGTFTLKWSKPVAERTWVAVSLDAFRPPERDSADLIIPIGRCDRTCTAATA